MENCNTSSLQVYAPSEENPWDTKKAHHLYRRLAFGASPAIIEVALAKTPEEIVDLLMDEALGLEPTPAPEWAGKGRLQLISEGFDFEEINQEHVREMQRHSVNDALNNNLRAVLTLFWHNHFVTQQSEYNCASYTYEYYSTLQLYSLGNFKEFVRKIGLTNAMLTFLNGRLNNKYIPNENYARELYELFTLGENNGYTQQDIEETAKALTGYNKGGYCENIEFDSSTYDDSEKTIFGRTGVWDYDWAIDILFEEKAPLIAEFIVAKLYAYFVNPDVDPIIVSELASEFEVDFEIAPILRKLFKSEHFFDEKSMATLIKSPFDINIHFIKVMGFAFTEEQKTDLYWQNAAQGQQYFQPVDVAGWQGDYDWINTSTITARWAIVESNIWRAWGSDEDPGNTEKFREFVKLVADGSQDVNVIVRRVIDTFLPQGLNTEANYTDATDIFKTDFLPEDYFTNGIWTLDFESVPWQTVLLLQYIIRLPEFQLK